MPTLSSMDGGTSIKSRHPRERSGAAHLRQSRQPSRQKWRETLSAVAVLAVIGPAVGVVVAVVGAVPAGAAIVTTQASLVNGQLTLIGSGAVPNANIAIDGGPTTFPADRQGRFSYQASDFSEPSCVITLDDGSVTVEEQLSGCTPTISPPPFPPDPPALLGPASGASKLEPVTLSWQPPIESPGASYRWQVSTEPDFRTLVLTATTNPRATSTVLSGLAPGSYFWRVQSVSFPPVPYLPMHGDWTPTQALTITGEAPGTPATPSFTFPTSGSQYHPEESFPLAWTVVQQATSYRLQMARNSSFTPGSILIDVAESGTTASAPLFGFQVPALYLRVFGVNAHGVLGLPSPTLPLQITFKAPVPPAPSLVSPADGATVLLPVVLAWTSDPNPQTEGYQLQISSTARFPGGCGGELCVTGLSQPTDTLFSLPAGTHFWRVRSFHGLAGPDRGAATAWSASRSFTISNAPPTVRSLTIDVFSGGGTVLRSHTHAFSGATEDNAVFGVVQLTTPARKGGEVVTLASSNPAVASLPTSITIRGGQAAKAFRISPKQVIQSTAVTLSATLNSRTVGAPLTVDPSNIRQVAIDAGPPAPPVFSGGTPQLGSIFFNGIAPIGSVIALTSSSPVASIPSSVTVQRDVIPTFPIATEQVTVPTKVVLTGTWREQSKSVTMTLQPPPTTKSPPSGSSFATGQRVTFIWHEWPHLFSELQIADTARFAHPIVDINTDNITAWSFTDLPSGKLYWRVLGVDEYGAFGPPSTVNTFTVRPPAGPLPPPTLLFPANGATITAGQEVAFLWQVLNGAADYELQVATSTTFTAPLVMDETLPGNEVDTTTLPVDTLYWRVRGIDSNRNPGLWSTTFQLTITPE